MPSFATRFLAARYGSLIVAVFALNLAGLSLAGFSVDANRAQVAHAQGDRSSHAAAAPLLADGWRRTAQGWQWLPAVGEERNPREVPTEHVALSQGWPAAWAACVVLSVFGLAAAGTERKEIDACFATGDQVGYDLSRAA